MIAAIKSVISACVCRVERAASAASSRIVILALQLLVVSLIL